MPQHYQVVIKDDGKTFVRSLDGAGQLSPDESASIAGKIAATATEPSYVYIGYQASTNRHKIGLSIKPPRRAKELDIEILHTIKCQAWGDNSARSLERTLHTFFKLMGQHIEGEWFRLTEFDLWDLKDEDDATNGGHHKWYEVITKDLTGIREEYDKQGLANPFRMAWHYSEKFWDTSDFDQVMWIYESRYMATLASHTQETTLARCMKEYSVLLEEHYLKHQAKEAEKASKGK